GRVRREERGWEREAIELGERLALQLELLEHGLDDEVAIGEIGELGRERQARDRSVAFFLRHPSLLDAARQVALDRGASTQAELVADLAADRLEARLDAALCDASAHRPDAADAAR